MTMTTTMTTVTVTVIQRFNAVAFHSTFDNTHRDINEDKPSHNNVILISLNSEG